MQRVRGMESKGEQRAGGSQTLRGAGRRRGSWRVREAQTWRRIERGLRVKGAGVWSTVRGALRMRVAAAVGHAEEQKETLAAATQGSDWLRWEGSRGDYSGAAAGSGRGDGPGPGWCWRGEQKN